MKKLLYSIIALTGLAFASCTQEHIDVQYNPENAVAPVLGAIEGCELSDGGADIVVEYTKADFGVATANAHNLYISKSEDMADMKKAKAAFADATITLTQADLNVVALDLAEAGAEVDLYFAVVANLNTDKGAAVAGSDLMSNVVKATFKSYVADVLPSEKFDKMYVVGTLNGWDHPTVAKEFDFLYNYDSSNANLYAGIIDLRTPESAAEFKFTDAGGWGSKEHSMTGENAAEASTVTLVAGGGDNINVWQTKRFYGAELDLGGLTLKKLWSADQIGIIGLNGDWESDIVMEYNAKWTRFYADIEAAEATEMKFRADAAWDINWGVDCAMGGGNIPVAAGQYRVYFNPVTGLIEFNAKNYGTEEDTGAGTTPEPPAPPVVEKEPNRWGIVGDLTGWGEQADLYMDEVGTDVYVRRSLALTTANMFKIRFNDEWKDDANYGLEEDGAVNPNEGFAVITSGGSKNIMISADGTYDVWFNKAESKVWVMTEGQTPEGITLKSVKLYVNVSAPGWENCNIWAWDGDGANYSGGTWPGQALATETVDGVEYYVWEAPAAAVGKTISVIFNNGTAQTADITGVVLDKDHFFVLNDDLSYTMDGEVPEAPVSSVKLYANVSAPGWENCNIWAWDGDGANYSGGTWPGQDLATETVDGVEYYVWEAPEAAVGKTISVIFNNGSAQTADITGVVLDKNHFFVINADLSYTMDGDAPATPDPSDIVYGLVGTINGWSAPDINFEDNGDGGYKLLGYTLTASDEIKIRANGTWNDATNYGLEQAGVLVTNEANVLICGGGSKNMKVAADGTYDFYFYPEELKLYVMEQGKVPTR